MRSAGRLRSLRCAAVLPGCALLLLLAGCAHRGFRLPGPTDALGEAPPTYLERHGLDPAVAAAASASAGPIRAAPERKRQSPGRRGGKAGEKVAREVAAFVGTERFLVDGETFRYDCSGMVEAAYAAAGCPVKGSSKDMFELARERGVLHTRKRPAVGDVAFFDNTYDRNGNGRRDDELTHVAIVEEVLEDGTIIMVHKGNQGVTRLYMNLLRPDALQDDEGNPLNHHLRAPSRKRPGPTLTSELFRAFGSLWAIDSAPMAAAPAPPLPGGPA